MFVCRKIEIKGEQLKSTDNYNQSFLIASKNTHLMKTKSFYLNQPFRFSFARWTNKKQHDDVDFAKKKKKKIISSNKFHYLPYKDVINQSGHNWSSKTLTWDYGYQCSHYQ